MLRGLWRHVEHNFREGGPKQILAKFAMRIGQLIWSESPWLVYRLDAREYRLEPALPLTSRKLGFDELCRLRYFKAESFPESIRERLDSGHVCHGFFSGPDLVNVAWTTHGYLDMEPGLVIHDPVSSGIYDCYTLPEHRSKGIYRDTLIRTIRALRDEGAEVVLISVHPRNLPSIKAIERAGFMPLHRIQHRCRFGVRSRVESPFSLVT
jgi:GNAT superfamily N-acetyltransferase